MSDRSAREVDAPKHRKAHRVGTVACFALCVWVRGTGWLAVRAGGCFGVALPWVSVSAVICPVVSVSGAVLSWVDILMPVLG